MVVENRRLQILAKTNGHEMDQRLKEAATVRLIAIVSASGGLQALPEILSALPRDFPVPILVLPRIHPKFLKELVARLDAKCLLQVTVAEDGQVPEPGHVYVASDDLVLVVAQGRLRHERGNPDCTRVTGNALFRSMARDVGSGALAVILTGMGNDGAQGMKEVRDAGGYTIVQDRATSVVSGTAKLAVELNAACEVLALQEIAPKLVALVARGARGFDD
jgi:two-component system, chemotaxis family, protein-glutamate methylesterase/glutaminase